MNHKAMQVRPPYLFAEWRPNPRLSVAHGHCRR